MSQESKNKLKNSWFYHLMVDNKYINMAYHNHENYLKRIKRTFLISEK